jgi:hypothetical protein
VYIRRRARRLRWNTERAKKIKKPLRRRRKVHGPFGDIVAVIRSRAGGRDEERRGLCYDQHQVEAVTGTATHESKPPDFFPLLAYGGAGVVSILAPGRVPKMDDEITVVGGHTIVERDLANSLPVSNGVSLPLGEESKARFFPCLRDGYVKAEGPLRLGIPLIKEMGQDFMAHILFVDHRLSSSSF